ncbi:MAG TPA: cupin domain-containing protein [Stellaceae bacterium]|nr:cupin domain-containing protein [Stellaceae bacterium]
MDDAIVRPALGTGDHKSRLADLHRRDEALDLFEFWGEDAGDEHQATDRLRAGRLDAVPHLWRYREIYPCLLEAARLVPMALSERRSLIMVNPALKPLVATVTTLFAAYRINVPHEIMPPHRHSPNAIRFGLTGATNFTSVEGEAITFGPGDLVLTPHDTWHNHGNGPDDASVNLSVLDMPLVNILNATYFEFDGDEDGTKRLGNSSVPTDYSQRAYGSGGLMPRFVSHRRGAGTGSPMFVYRWAETEALLAKFRDHDGSPHDGITIEFVNPVTGGPVYRTMTFLVQMLRKGERLLPVRQNANQICTVFRGTGHSIVGGKRFDWEKFDTFCIPGGTWCEHVNDAGEDAIFLVSSDEPTLRALGFAVKHGRTSAGDIVLLEGAR